MVDFNSVLEDALKLSPLDQTKLIDALCDAIPDNADMTIHPDWASELQRQVSGLSSGSDQAS